ncbi:hypothetical protein KUTeg_011155 [Tegillarca granosa]|uniref:Transposase n=1 Tax=Tegillarca granosa TaxID=220873 RepID=A0ABQ9F1S8_TEGGR|nr:hypothetical protein KUTeg_011155 [Tegillarca granosa]
MLTAEEQDYLKSIWTDPKHAGSFAGPEKLYKIVHREGKFNIGLRRIRQFLSDQDAYSLQKRVQRKFPRNHIVAEGIDSQWDCDLMDVKNLIKWNKNVQYILVAQDVFSRYVFAEPMKQKERNRYCEKHWINCLQVVESQNYCAWTRVRNSKTNGLKNT